MSMKSGIFHLKNFEIDWGEKPGDKLLIERQVTLSSSAGTIDLTGIVKAGSQLTYYMTKTQTLDTDSVLDVTAAVPGATDTVNVAIICRPEDLA